MPEMNEVVLCKLYIEELVESGLPKIGGICPECLQKVSMHQRIPVQTYFVNFLAMDSPLQAIENKKESEPANIAECKLGNNVESNKNILGKSLTAEKSQKVNLGSSQVGAPKHTEVYMEDSIREEDMKRFAASGILMYKFVKGTLRVLLGIEYRMGEYGMVLNMLGGKKDHGEQPKETAIREFWEESGKLYTKQDIQNEVLSSSTKNIWFGPGLYVAYLVTCPQSMTDIDERYNKLERRDATAEMAKLMWVRWDDLVGAAASPPSSGHPEVVVRVWRQNFTYRLSEFLIRLLRNDIVVNALRRPDVIHQVIADLAEVVNREYQLTKSVKVPAQSKDWQLKIKLPTAAPV
eukprot:gene14398-30658_t